MNLAAVTLPTILLLTLVFRVDVAAGPGLLLFPVSLLLAFLVSFCFDYIVGLMAFYTESVWGLSITKEIVVTVLSGALVPLQFFPDGIQRVLLWLPFQAIYHAPLMMMTRPALPLESYLPALGSQLTWAVVLFALARVFYNQAVKVLRISGG
jgi:ABC-2 type transport system permease protein